MSLMLRHTGLSDGCTDRGRIPSAAASLHSVLRESETEVRHSHSYGMYRCGDVYNGERELREEGKTSAVQCDVRHGEG